MQRVARVLGHSEPRDPGEKPATLTLVRGGKANAPAPQEPEDVGSSVSALTPEISLLNSFMDAVLESKEKLNCENIVGLAFDFIRASLDINQKISLSDIVSIKTTLDFYSAVNHNRFSCIPHSQLLGQVLYQILGKLYEGVDEKDRARAKEMAVISDYIDDVIRHAQKVEKGIICRTPLPPTLVEAPPHI